MPHTSKSCTLKFSWQSGGLSKVSQCSVRPQSRLASRDRAWPPPPPAKASKVVEMRSPHPGRGTSPANEASQDCAYLSAFCLSPMTELGWGCPEMPSLPLRMAEVPESSLLGRQCERLP